MIFVSVDSQCGIMYSPHMLPEIKDWRSEMVEGKDYFIKKKSESWLMRTLGKILFFNKQFMTGYFTTIGSTIYIPDGWDSVPGETLAHELQHIKDSKALPVIYELSYLLCLPALFTMRSFWEWRAYRVTLMVSENLENLAYWKEFMRSQFCSSMYLWMLPFSGRVNSMVEKEIKRLISLRTN